VSTPKGNAVLVEALGSALRRGGNALEDVPDLLKRVLEEESWREFVTPRGELVRHERFVDFVTTAPTQGIGASVDLVRRIVKDDPESLDLLDRALQNAEGGSPEQRATVANSNSGRPSGTTQAAALRRLRKDAPSLHSEVLAGRLSAHAAMVQAGFRPKTISVPVGRPESIAAALRKHLDADGLARLIRLLLDEP
jgi:hypothetical protein